MTSDEIKKALECCSEHEACHNCPCKKECGDLSVVTTEALIYINKLESEVESITGKFDCQQQVYADLSKIIKTQKTEIDGLKSRNINNCRHWQKKYISLRAKAIKEFSERLKEESSIECDVSMGFGRPCYEDTVPIIAIDNLVKEMVGETDDT